MERGWSKAQWCWRLLLFVVIVTAMCRWRRYQNTEFDGISRSLGMANVLGTMGFGGAKAKAS